MRVGLDVGGTKTDAVAVADDGSLVARTRRVTGWGSAAVVASIVDAVEDLESRGLGAVRSVGIGIPGTVEPGTGRVEHAVNLGVESLELAAAVSPLLGVAVHVENDVKAAARGAHALRGPLAPASMAYLNLGTGVAAGIVVDGKLHRGGTGVAGEVGHISVDPLGPVCRCGQRGCIEALAGGGSIAEQWGGISPLPVRDVFDAADAGDARARLLRRGLALGVAAAVRVLVLSVDAEVVVIGGGLTGLGRRLTDDVRAELAASAAASPFLASLRLAERIEILPAGSPAAALGAALAAGTVAGIPLMHASARSGLGWPAVREAVRDG